MSTYRRANTTGGTHFFTVVTFRRHTFLCDEPVRNALRNPVLETRAIQPFTLVWQRRFWEHMIRDEADFARHSDTLHCNPVKHGLVKRVKDWPLSTFHRYVQAGFYSIVPFGGLHQFDISTKDLDTG